MAFETWRQVDAYRDKVGDKFPEKFADLPIISKQDYLLSYPMEQLCRKGDMDHIHLIGASSGFSKSGAVFWPKRPCDEKAYMEGIEQMFIDHYHIDTRKTLCIECLAFGMWIAGMQIAASIRNIALSGRHGFTIATPGLDLKEAVSVIKSYHERYDQLLIITNPSNIPIITALIQDNGIRLKPGTVYFPVVGEYFTESLREHICAEYGHPADSTSVLWTGYGSADTGDVSCETVPSILIRKWFASHPDRSREYFGTVDTPMMLNINDKCLVEIIDGHIVVTKDQFIPLVRYDTKDRGGLIERETLRGVVPDELLDAMPEHWMYVFGRADNAVIFYGTNLMIGDIQQWLLSLPEVEGYGGLFTVHESVDNNISSLCFTIYTKGDNHSDCDRFQALLLKYLCGNSAEFSYKYHNLSKSYDRPLVTVQTEDISTLQGNLKHRFII